MKDFAKEVWDSRWFLWLCVGWLVALACAFFAPTIDGYFRPAVSSFTVDLLRSERVGDAVYLRGTFIKERCTFIGVSVTGHRNGQPNVKLPVLFQDNKHDQTENRPEGPQQFGPWRIFLMPPGDVWGISMRAAHECELRVRGKRITSWTIYTNLGSVVVLDSLKGSEG